MPSSAAQQPSTPRPVHEEVLPPPPLASSLLLASVQEAAAQQNWLHTIALMRRQEGADMKMLDTIAGHITLGVSLPLVSIPPPVSYQNTPVVDEHADAVRARLADYMSIGAVNRLPDNYDIKHESVQPLHVIIKAEKKPRVVVDLSRNLNDHLEHTYFHYSNVDSAVSLSTPHCWYGKLDLSNCFLSFPLHPSVHRYFIFRFEGALYQFVRMPFGLATAPLVCSQLLSVPSFVLTSLGIKHVRYLDDFLLISHDRNILQQQLHTAQTAISSFGLVINGDKTEGPSQIITFLGIELDSLARTLRCPLSRITELVTLLNSARGCRHMTRRTLESLIGKLSFAAQVLPGARPFMRRMLDTLHACTHRGRSSVVHLDTNFHLDVEFWLSHLALWNGTQPASVSTWKQFLLHPASTQAHGLSDCNWLLDSVAHTPRCTPSSTEHTRKSRGVSC
jgi:hypothetical protein